MAVRRPPADHRRCTALNADGERCQLTRREGEDKCRFHAGADDRCQATTANGVPCVQPALGLHGLCFWHSPACRDMARRLWDGGGAFDADRVRLEVEVRERGREQERERER